MCSKLYPIINEFDQVVFLLSKKIVIQKKQE